MVDPDGADGRAERRHERRGLWLTSTFEGMVAVNGLLEPEAGHTLLAALEPPARPAGADDRRSGGQRHADALLELARRALEGGQLPQTGGVRAQLTVTVDLDTLIGRNNSLGAEPGWTGPLEPEACRRLACDGALTRVLVTRDPAGHPHPDLRPGEQERPATPAPGGEGWGRGFGPRWPSCPALGRRPTQPLEVGRTSRVVAAAQRTALAVHDGGCVFPDCHYPLAWCEAHHLQHWLHGGPTDLANLALLCRAHHRAVHEGGWRLQRQPDGRPADRHPPHRRQHAAT